MTKDITQRGRTNVNVEVNNGTINIKERSIPNELVSIPDISLTEVIGREDDIKNVGKLMENSEKVVLVNGLGGIGKTTIAKSVLKKFRNDYKHVCWISITSGIKSMFGN